jgi:ACS family pantothenate transporter-like MFS transporter
MTDGESKLRRENRARWLLPSLEIAWGIVTFAQSRVTNVNQLYVCRFLVGMLEAPVFAGTHFILGETLLACEYIVS